MNGLRLLVVAISLCATNAVAQQLLEITPASQRVPVGGIRGFTISCVNCDNPPVGGRIDMSTDNSSIATVSPREVFLFQNPAITAVNVTGVGEGTTLLRVKLFEGFSTIPILQVVATVNVSAATPTCPATTLLAEQPDGIETLTLLYRFRDEVLAETERGRIYTQRFYRNAWEVSEMLHNDPALFEQAHELLLRIMPHFDAILSGRFVLLTTDDVAEIDALLSALEIQASRRLGTAVNLFRHDLKSGNVLGQFGVGIEKPRPNRKVREREDR